MTAENSTSSNVMPGRFLMLIGVVGIVAGFASAMDGLPSSLQSFVRSNSAMWWLGSGAFLVCGMRMLWTAGYGRTEWEPERSGVRFHSVIVYTQPDCPLCDEAMDVLLRYRPWLPIATEVNILDDVELLERYQTSVPVVVIDGKLRFRGRVSEVLVRRLVEGTRPVPVMQILK
ncbi:glutaredoxin family protein [Planctomicrobium sp. SH668]|uniref:glutaredoxin family protein n=1 Tax=Planctomicrobium sp. SH668 TaxID=3448126 RepID=UPI003F5AEA8F